MEAAGSCVLETYRLTKMYQNRQIALNDINLRVEPGCVLGLLGANGAGKTTLIRLILGLHRPTTGWVKVFGRRMPANAAGLRRRIGYIPTQPRFPRGATPIDFLDFTGRLFGLPREVRQTRLGALLRAVNLLEVSGEPIASLSTGLQARLSVAASLINEPDLLIWDEPTQGLDPEARRSMLELVKALSRHKTLILSSHNLSDVDEVCTHAAVLSRGHLIFFGSLQDLKGRMKRNHFELDLEGEHKAISKAAQTIRNLPEFKVVQVRHRRLELQLTEQAANASALANVFMTLADNKVNLVSIRTVGQQTEQAFLDLVERDESRGFARVYVNGED